MRTREAILSGLRAAAFDAPLPPVYAGGAEGGLTARFIERAAEVGATARVLDLWDLPQAIVDAVRGEPEGALLIWEDPLLEASARALQRAGVMVISGEAETRETAAAAGFGLTTAEYAIAETGTLVLGCGPGRSRAASLLPAHHLAVLPEGRIRADLAALLRDVGRPLPSALTFITGPSRTADIGLTLVRPAHGPTTVTVFLVRG